MMQTKFRGCARAPLSGPTDRARTNGTNNRMAKSDSPTDGESRETAMHGAQESRETWWEETAGTVLATLVTAAIIGVGANWLDDRARAQALDDLARRLEAVEAGLDRAERENWIDRYTGTNARQDWATEDARHDRLNSRLERIEKDIKDIQLEIVTHMKYPDP